MAKDTEQQVEGACTSSCASRPRPAPLSLAACCLLLAPAGWRQLLQLGVPGRADGRPASHQAAVLEPCVAGTHGTGAFTSGVGTHTCLAASVERGSQQRSHGRCLPSRARAEQCAHRLPLNATAQGWRSEAGASGGACYFLMPPSVEEVQQAAAIGLAARPTAFSSPQDVLLFIRDHRSLLPAQALAGFAAGAACRVQGWRAAAVDGGRCCAAAVALRMADPTSVLPCLACSHHQRARVQKVVQQ